MFVDFFVALGAEQHEVGDIGGAVVVPPIDVVSVACAGSHATADAALVSDVEGELLGMGGGSLLSPQVQRLAVGSEDGGHNSGVAGDVPELVIFDWGRRR